MLIALACVAVAIGAAVKFSSSSDSKKSPSTVPHALTRTVTYIVTGDHTNQASITHETPSGTGQPNDVDVPLTRKSDGGAGIQFAFHSGDFVYISAQNSDESGAVTCSILVDGQIIATNTSSGAYAIATCKGHA